MTARKEGVLSSQYSAWSFLLFAIATTGYTCEALSDLALFNVGERGGGHSWSVCLISCFFRTVGALFVWLIWYAKDRKTPTPASEHIQPWMSFFLNSYHILLISSLAIRVVLDVTNGSCDDNFLAVHEYRPCNDFQHVRLLNPTNYLVLMFLPLLAFFLVRDTYVETVAISWLLSIGTILYCSLYMNSAPMLIPILIYAYVSVLILYDSDRQNSDMICIIDRLHATLLENEKLHKEAQARELRAMIGNVAHDLKTPLTSLSSGIECIQECLTTFDQVHIAKIADFESQSAASSDARSMRTCLQGMLSANSFMTMCINRCLDYTKASKGLQLVPRPEPIALAETVDFPVRIMRDVQSLLDIRVLPYDLNICPHIITDKQWLTENLLCLLSNAVRYSNQGQVEVNLKVLDDGENFQEYAAPSSSLSLLAPSRVEIPCSNRASQISPTAERFLRFEVQDHGVGISEEAVETLFHPTKQAQRLAGGTGLGLFSLAKRVEALKGQYGVMNRPDGAQGSLFWFTIPYVPDEFSGSHFSTAASSPRGITPSFTPRSPCGSCDLSEGICDGPGSLSWFNSPSARSVVDSAFVSVPATVMQSPQLSLRVLVVDDAPTILKMTTMLLRKKGHTVEQAVNGAQALELMVAHPAPYYDVVLMDLQMPVMAGIEAIRRLRAMESGAKAAFLAEPSSRQDLESGHFPALAVQSQFIIAISANSDSVTIEEALVAGASDFIGKPFSYESFFTVVERHLNSR